MSQKHQQGLIEKFFADTPDVSQITCHEAAAQLLGVAADYVEQAPVQVHLSYFCLVRSPHNEDHTTCVQFHKNEINLESNKIAHATHGDIVPQVTAHGKHHDLFMYAFLFIGGEPYIHTLSSPEGDPPVSHRRQTLQDLVPIFGRFAFSGVATTVDTLTLLSKIGSDLPPCDERTKKFIERAILKVQPSASDIDSLPLVLAHPQLFPWNFLIDPPTGKITAVLGWEGAIYERFGWNLHFAEPVLGYMELHQGWLNFEERTTLEKEFYDALEHQLLIQGLDTHNSELNYRMLIHMSRAVGALAYYLPKMKEGTNPWYEKSLIGFLENWEAVVN